ncbi:DUF317 domain-containing protein [Streptomyces mirabilis]|uniref:DUF317 domain-containing protein n=1 Tax=Streptomyces mirabilis TaxID=68239 RepID=A0A1I2VN84_9ACTN|nr:DUF317 domain-containing protein [Streptomyces mirabilis]SFG90600.1 protein of unknown function [Streptomyces mirabilis]
MTPTATIPFQPVPERPQPALGERGWLLECRCARPVTDLLHAQGWDVVTDLDCNVHCSSPDRRVYVGFLPESREAARGELWHIHVTDKDGATAWHQTFGPDTPAQAVAGFLATLIAFPTRYCTCV